MTETTPLERKETEEPPRSEEQTVAPLTETQRMILGLAKTIDEQNARLARMENFLDPKKFDDWLKESLTPLVANIQKRFEAVEQRVSQAPSGSGEKGVGGINGILDLVGKIADKVQIGAKPASSAFAQEAQSMFEDIIKLDLKEMLRSRRSMLGLPPPAAAHIVLETQ